MIHVFSFGHFRPLTSTAYSSLSTDQPLRQLDPEGFEVLQLSTPSWPVLPHQDVYIHDTAIHEKPKDVPVTGEKFVMADLKFEHLNLCINHAVYRTTCM